ncbi:MAG: sulfatase [Planctomycetes bacterium]|nr:sulfatase [Planctomycetota bacterium]
MKLLAASPLLLAVFASCSRDGSSTAPPISGATATRPPDVLLISIDSLRADHLGCYGYPKPTSPVIDRLASEGVRFETAVSTTSWTLPAHAALFTGLYDSTHGVVDNGLALPAKARTLAESLHERGYRTAGFYGGPYLHPVFGLGQGFDVYESCMSLSVGEPGAGVKRVLDPREVASHTDVTGPRTLDAVKRHLATAASDVPQFLFVHLWDVHYDYQPPESYWRRFDPDYTGTLDARNVATNPAIHERMPARDLQHLIALYDGEIAFTDEIVGRILDAWKERRDLDRTLVVITADHGEEFFEHRGKGHQHTLFDEVLRVPLVVRWPAGIAGTRVVKDPVRLIDVFPTLAAATGASTGSAVQGRDLGPLLAGKTLPPQSALCELLVDGGDVRALRTDALKVLRFQGGRETFALDLANDPKETRPLPPNSPALERGAAELVRELEAARRLADERKAPPKRITVERALQDSLRGFGYLGGADEDEPAKPR